jgi:hypothetical protein
MPDVFVAPDEKKETITHKRVPLPSSASDKQAPALTSDRDSYPSVASETVQQNAAALENPVEKKIKQTTNQESRGGVPLFTSFWKNPKGISFDTQEADEHILLFLRQHFITNIPWIFVSIVLLFVPPGVSYLLSLTQHPFTFLPPQFTALAVVFYYLVVLTNAFTNFLKWYYNISLITPQRMLDVELKDLVDKKIVATKMSLVQDASAQYAGTLRTVFNFGDILIQTAGPIDNFVINATPHPEVVVRTIEELIGKGRENDNAV